MPDDLHERLTDYLTNLEVTVRPVDGHAHIVAESMADALLPFIRAEIRSRRSRRRTGAVDVAGSILTNFNLSPTMNR